MDSDNSEKEIDQRLQILLDRIKAYPEEFGYDPSSFTYKERWGMWFASCFKALTDEEQNLIKRQIEISKREEALNAIMETIVDPPKKEAGVTLGGVISGVYNNMFNNVSTNSNLTITAAPSEEKFYWKK